MSHNRRVRSSIIRTGLVAAGLATALLISSCGGGAKKQLVVAFSQANNAEPYRAAQNALMAKLFAQYPDVKLVISEAQQDNSKQVAQVETFIRQKPGLLIVAPNERAAPKRSWTNTPRSGSWPIPWPTGFRPRPRTA